MPVSILEVDVNDEKFKQYEATFAKYEALARTLPSTWEAVNKATSANISALRQSAAQIAKMQKAMAGVAKQQNLMMRVSQTTATQFVSLAKSSGSIASNITKATTSLLKWAGITSVLGGLVGGGGLFGITRLAESVSNNRRQSQGLGTTYGENKAFDLSYGKYVDSGSFLSNVNESVHDLSKRWALSALGISEHDIQSKDTAQLAQEALPLIRQKYLASGQTAQGAHAYGLDQFMSLEDLNRLAKASPEDLQSAQNTYGKNSKLLDLSDQTAESWQNFKYQLDTAGDKIENVFVKALDPLIPSFTQLSDALANAFGTVLGDPHFKEYLDDAAVGLQDFAKYLVSDDFKESTHKFFAVIDALGTHLYDLLGKLGWVGPDSSGGSGAGGDKPGAALDPNAYADATSEQEKGIRDIGIFHGNLSTAAAINDAITHPNDYAAREKARQAMAAASDSVKNPTMGPIMKGLFDEYGFSSLNDSPETVIDMDEVPAIKPKAKTVMPSSSEPKETPITMLDMSDFPETANAMSAPDVSSGVSGPHGERHNPGNLRVPGANAFQSFASDADGVQAMANQLLLYQNRDHLDTLQDIISKYAPPKDAQGHFENDTPRYIRDVSKETGFDPKEHLSLTDTATLSTVMSAMLKEEGSKGYSADKVAQIISAKQGQGSIAQPVIIEINNNTGGSAIVSSRSIAY